MENKNPTGCIFPSCSCQYRCADLFSKKVPDLRGGKCAACNKPSTVYQSGSLYFCKSCLADQLGLVKKESA